MTKRPTTTAKARRIYKTLADLGIARVEAEYDGCGDSGCVAALQAFDADGKEMTLPVVTIPTMLECTEYVRGGPRRRRQRQQLPIDEAVHQWCYDLLEESFPGWELDGGSSGTITFDVMKRKGSIAHTAHIVDHYDDSAEF